MNSGGNATERETAILAALVDENIITRHRQMRLQVFTIGWALQV